MINKQATVTFEPFSVEQVANYRYSCQLDKPDYEIAAGGSEDLFEIY